MAKMRTSKITAKQIRAVHAMARARRLDEAAYRDVLAQYGAQHSTDLTKDQAADLIKSLRGGAPQPAPSASRYTGAGSRGTRISDHLTQEQADEIARQEERLGMSGNPKRLYGLIHHVLGKTCSPSMLMKFEASKLIMVMRTMRKRA